MPNVQGAALEPLAPAAPGWVEQLAVPVHLRSADDYRELLANAGWADAQAEVRAPDPSDPNPDEHAHACLVTARKP